jgi:hypothetical protein
VKGKRVYGTVPYHLACYATSVTELQFKKEKGVDITLNDLENDATATFHTYIIKKIDKVPVVTSDVKKG